jgi:hypothetical protein
MDSSGYALLWRVPEPTAEELIAINEGQHGPPKIDAYSQRCWQQWRAAQVEKAEAQDTPALVGAFDPASEEYEESF